MWCGPGNWSGWWQGGWSPLVFFGFVALAGWLLLRRGPQNGPRHESQPACKNCGIAVEDAFFRCPECGHTLKTHCPACSRVVETNWDFCPYCSEDVSARTAATPQPQEGEAT